MAGNHTWGNGREFFFSSRSPHRRADAPAVRSPGLECREGHASARSSGSWSWQKRRRRSVLTPSRTSPPLSAKPKKDSAPMPTRRHGAGSTFTEDSWTDSTPDGTRLRPSFPPPHPRNNHMRPRILVKRFFFADLIMCQCAQVPKPIPRCFMAPCSWNTRTEDHVAPLRSSFRR